MSSPVDKVSKSDHGNNDSLSPPLDDVPSDDAGEDEDDGDVDDTFRKLGDLQT